MNNGWYKFLEALQTDHQLRKEWLELLDERIRSGPNSVWKGIKSIEEVLIKEWPDKSDFGPVSP